MNRKNLLALAAALAIVWAFFSSRQIITNYPSSGTHIIAFGDSLVEGVGSTQGGGFVKMLSDELQIPIINLGRRGDTTEDGLARVAELNRYKPKVVMLLLGGNDYLTGVPRETTFDNLGKLISEIHKRGSIVLLIGLNDEYKDLAREMGAALVPDILEGIYGTKKLMSDNLHPNDPGYELMAERIKPNLERLIR